MADALDRAETLSRELEAAFRNRADLYRLLLEELAKRFGDSEAESVLTAVVAERGREVAATAFASLHGKGARAIGQAFLSASPDEGRMYPTTVTYGQDEMSFRVERCPLKDAWVEAGVDDARLAVLCRIAGSFDRALFEATGVTFENTTWLPGSGAGCCQIRLTDARARDRDGASP